jgi:hypothetical protein
VFYLSRTQCRGYLSANAVGKGNRHGRRLWVTMFIETEGVQGLCCVGSAQPLGPIIKRLIVDVIVCTELFDG